MLKAILGEAWLALVGAVGALLVTRSPASVVVFIGLILLVDLGISFGIMLIMFAWYGFMPSWHIIFFPLFVVLAFTCAFGIGLYLTAVNVKYRDFRYIIPFIVQFGLYVSPVGFSSFVINEKYRMLYSLNPMVGVIDGFRIGRLPSI